MRGCFSWKLAAQVSERASLVDEPSNEHKELKMKTSHILAAAALTLLAATGAQAESYDGVNTAVSKQISTVFQNARA